MLKNECKEEFGWYVLGIWYFGVQVRLFIRGGGKRKRRDVFDSEIPPGLSTEPITSII